jgi:hypothetical protein
MSFIVGSQDGLPFLLAPKYSLAGLAWRLVFVFIGNIQGKHAKH